MKCQLIHEFGSNGVLLDTKAPLVSDRLATTLNKRSYYLLGHPPGAVRVRRRYTSMEFHLSDDYYPVLIEDYHFE